MIALALISLTEKRKHQGGNFIDFLTSTYDPFNALLAFWILFLCLTFGVWWMNQATAAEKSSPTTYLVCFLQTDERVCWLHLLTKNFGSVFSEIKLFIWRKTWKTRKTLPEKYLTDFMKKTSIEKFQIIIHAIQRDYRGNEIKIGPSRPPIVRAVDAHENSLLVFPAIVLWSSRIEIAELPCKVMFDFLGKQSWIHWRNFSVNSLKFSSTIRFIPGRFSVRY